MNSHITPLISIIVPIYNVENYVCRCIESILKQTYVNLQILLIDDGSTDGSTDICKEYKDKDKRIKYIRKENGGLSEARNTGISYMEGKYVAFIDGDDFIAEDYIEYLYKLLCKHEADIAICNYQKLFEHEELKSEEKEKVILLLEDEGLENLLYQRYYTMSAWGKLYKGEIIQGIEFPVGRLHEDVGTVYKYLVKAKKVVYSSKRKYGYIQRKNSIVNSEFTINKMDYIKFTEEIVQYIERERKKLYNAAVSRHFSACFEVIIKIPKNSKVFKEQYGVINKEIDKYKIIVACDKKARLKNRIVANLSFINKKLVVSIIRKIESM